jgi:tRNA modification GTPase
VVTQARHLEQLQKIHSCLAKAVDLINTDSSPEFIAFELQEAIRAIHELLGKEFHEQVIDRIFKEFCLGK